ncbi:hypothetical protein GCM10010277_17070 [Streptomyces longisporoflavus]|nr:hypothetical protein GCM10010277_17070 [Streptomyces longisporoflavus]
MMRSLPGSVVAAARSRSRLSTHAGRRGGAPGTACAGAAEPGPACGGTAGMLGAACPGGAALPFGGYVTSTSTSPSVIGRPLPPGVRGAGRSARPQVLPQGLTSAQALT